MAITPGFSLHLASLGGQEMLQRPEGVLNPAAPPPFPDQAWGGAGRFPAAQVVAIALGLVDDDDRHRPIRGAEGGEPGISDSGPVLALPPWPVGVGLEGPTLDLPPIGQLEDIGALALHQRPTVAGRHVRHQLAVTDPAIRDDRRWGQPSAPTLQ